VTIEVRPVAAADWPLLFDLWVESWTAFLPAIDFQARLPWFRDHVSALQEDGASILVAVDGSRLLGFVSVDARRQDMDQLVTAREAQRQGIGRLLVRAAKTHSPSGLDLKVVQLNQPAIALYRSEGFEIIGEGISEKSGLANFSMRWDGDRSSG
jgi:putative acetyltransferase